MFELSEKQISKIQKELDFFKSNGFNLTEETELSYCGKCVSATKYILNDNNGIEITCVYRLLYSERLSSSFDMWSDKWGTYVRSGIKTFNQFRKDFEV